MISIALHIPPAAEFSHFTAQVNFNSISTPSAFAIAPTEPSQACNHKTEHSNSCGITSVERGMQSIKSGIQSDKCGMTSVKTGIAAVKSGMMSVESGMTSAKRGMASVKHGITINLSDF
jgi:hypothetical protein